MPNAHDEYTVGNSEQSRQRHVASTRLTLLAVRVSRTSRQPHSYLNRIIQVHVQNWSSCCITIYFIPNYLTLIFQLQYVCFRNKQLMLFPCIKKYYGLFVHLDLSNKDTITTDYLNYFNADDDDQVHINIVYLLNSKILYNIIILHSIFLY